MHEPGYGLNLACQQQLVARLDPGITIMTRTFNTATGML